MDGGSNQGFRIIDGIDGIPIRLADGSPTSTRLPSPPLASKVNYPVQFLLDANRILSMLRVRKPMHTNQGREPSQPPVTGEQKRFLRGRIRDETNLN